VRSVLDRRLGGWTPAVLQVLRIAAVIGDVIDFPVLVKSIRLDLDTLADYLDEAADERIVVTWHSGGGYAFAMVCCASSCWRACLHCADNACTPSSPRSSRTVEATTH
jgi:hypothetical protein